MSNDINVFQEATKRKLRFNVGNGLITTEDLWDLTLTKLDEVAVAIDSTLTGEGQRKSFRANPDRKVTKQQEEDRLRVDVIAEVIRVKEEENARKSAAADKAARLAFLTELRKKREIDALQSLDLADIDKEIAALQEA